MFSKRKKPGGGTDRVVRVARGTLFAYDYPTLCPVLTDRKWVSSCGYPTRCPVLTEREVGISLLAPYEMSAADLPYEATRCSVLTSGMLLPGQRKCVGYFRVRYLSRNSTMVRLPNQMHSLALAVQFARISN
eukprot:3479588-Rhodomonas_salina.1